MSCQVLLLTPVLLLLLLLLLPALLHLPLLLLLAVRLSSMHQRHLSSTCLLLLL
jgi:hypothetical protein